MAPKQSYITSSTTSINVKIKLQEENEDSIPGSLLLNEIAANRKRGLHTDLEIFTKCQQRRQKVSCSLAHQAILSRVSPMLSTLFKHGISSNQLGPTPIVLILDTNVSWLSVEATLDLIYCGKQPKVDISVSDIDEILRLLGISDLTTSQKGYSYGLQPKYVSSQTSEANIPQSPSKRNMKRPSEFGRNKRSRGEIEPFRTTDSNKGRHDRADSTTIDNNPPTIVDKVSYPNNMKRNADNHHRQDVESDLDMTDEENETRGNINVEKKVRNSHSEDDGEAETLEVIGDTEEEDNESIMDEEEYQGHTAAAERATKEMKDDFRGNKVGNRQRKEDHVSSTTMLKCKTDNCGKTYAKDDIGSCESGKGFKGHILGCQHPVLQNQDLFQTMEGIESEDSSDELADDSPIVSTTSQTGANAQSSIKRQIQNSDRDRRAKKRSNDREDETNSSQNQQPQIMQQIQLPQQLQQSPSTQPTASSPLIHQLLQVGQAQQQKRHDPLPPNQHPPQKLEKISIKKEISDEDKALVCPHCLNNQGDEIKKFSSTMELFDHTENIRECSGAFILDQDQWNGTHGGTRCALCRREVFSLLHYQHHLALHYLGPLRNRFDSEFRRIEGQSYAACIECGLQMKSAGDHAIHKAVDHRRFLEWAPQTVKMHLVELGFGVKPKKPGA